MILKKRVKKQRGGEYLKRREILTQIQTGVMTIAVTKIARMKRMKQQN